MTMHAAVASRVSLRTLTSECVDLAKRAGELIREVSSKIERDGATVQLGLFDKGEAEGLGFDPQTVADRRAQRLIVENLRGVYGTSIRIVGEEGDLGSGEGSEDGAVELCPGNGTLLDETWPAAADVFVPKAELCIWIDPLDGTKEFTKGNYNFVTTLVGISRSGLPVAGVISEPYHAGPGGGTVANGRVLWGCCIAPEGRAPVGVRIFEDTSWSLPPRAKGRCLAVMSRSRAVGVVTDAVHRLQEEGCAGGNGALITGTFAAGGAGYKIARVVDGEADIWLFPRSGTSRWDICAAEAMLEASGGSLRDGFGRRIQYDPDGEMSNSQGVIAGSDPTAVERASRVCSTLDVLRQLDGTPINRSWLEQAMGLTPGSIKGFDADPSTCLRGLHSSTVQLKLIGHSEVTPSSVWLKRVVPADMPKRSAERWLRDVRSYHAEVNFYKDFANPLRARGVRLPAVHYVKSDGFEGIRSINPGDPDVMEKVSACRFLLLAEDLRPDLYRQEFYLQGNDLKNALKCAAQLHGSTFGDAVLLEKAAAELFSQACFWSPDKREASELDGLPDAWAALLQSIYSADPALFARPGIKDFGARLAAGSKFANGELRAEKSLASWRKKSILHGDYKTANLFLGREGGDVVPIDFQWCGVGIGAMDVAYLILSSPTLESVATSLQFDEWLSVYHKSLLEAGTSQDAGLGLASGPSLYCIEEFRRDFKLACLDYARVVFGHMLRNRSLNWVEENKHILGRCAHNRSVPHLLGLVRFLDRLLTELETTGGLSGDVGSIPGFKAIY